jgi:hypothetical protein
MACKEAAPRVQAALAEARQARCETGQARGRRLAQGGCDPRDDATGAGMPSTRIGMSVQDGRQMPRQSVQSVLHAGSRCQSTVNTQHALAG